MIGILVVDGDPRSAGRVMEALSRQSDMRVIGWVSTGIEALRTMQAQAPDILVSGARPLPDDDEAVIRLLAQPAEQRPLVLIAPDVEDAPSKYDSMIWSIRTWARLLHPSREPKGLGQAQDQQLERMAGQTLIRIGMPAHMQGYRYARTAIQLGLRDMGLFKAITRELYPLVADIHKTTPSGVERGIRRTIEASWQRGLEAKWNDIFDSDYALYGEKPTNAELLTAIADWIARQLVG